MQFSLNLQYKVRDFDREVHPEKLWSEDRKITDWLIRSAINAKYPNGIEERKVLRAAAAVQDELSSALNAGRDYVTLSPYQVEWLYDVLSSWKIPPGFAGWGNALLEYAGDVAKAAAAEGAKAEATK